MFLLNSCLSLFSAACFRRRPFSLSYGAILPSSLAMLLPSALGFSPRPPVSVFGTGARKAIAAFLGGWPALFATFFSLRFTALDCWQDLPCQLLLCLRRFLHSRLTLSIRVPTCSVYARYRNFRLLSIDYAFRPRLRPRLTQGRSALPWNPWTFGRRDSHPALATHSGILSS